MKTEDDFEKCFASQCGFCRENCPAYKGFELDSFSSLGKNRILKSYREGRLDIEDLQKMAFSCTLCGFCSETCPAGAGSYKYIREIREELFEKGKTMDGTLKAFSNIKRNKTPYSVKDTSWVEKGAKGRIGYFPGCTNLAHNPELAKKTFELLKKLGLKVVPITDFCCGSPLYGGGIPMEKYAKDVKPGVKTLIASCPGCVFMFRNIWKIKVYHIIEILVKYAGRIKFPKIDERIVYHDPCNLARKLGIIDEPRILLSKMTKETLEFDKNGKNTSCCGGGGNFPLNFPDEAALCAKQRVLETVELGADILATACPSCERMFRNVKDTRIKIMDIVELICTPIDSNLY